MTMKLLISCDATYCATTLTTETLLVSAARQMALDMGWVRDYKVGVYSYLYCPAHRDPETRHP